jgi:hypothetical protein
MKDPIKLIHKFKNNNHKIQYKIYIFVGSLVPDDVTKILEIIKNYDFYNSLIYLSQKQYNILSEYYGNRWYDKFFISHHLKNQMNIINESQVKKKELENKYGKDWYKENINKEKLQRITYSFESTYYDNLIDIKKKKLENKKPELNFRTYNTNNINSVKIDLQQTNPQQLGGDEDATDDDILNNPDELKKNDDDEEEEEEMNEEILDDIIEEEFDLEDINNLYLKENIESIKLIEENTKLISTAINDTKWDKKYEESTFKYDTSLDNLSYDNKIENIYIKYYIYDETIFKDDTIKTIQQKITVSIPISPNIHQNIKLLPETQYLWSEYNSINGKEEIMIGQKWIRKNELLKFDIEPNDNLKVYEKLKNNLSYLKDSFGYKIKREDDENNILRFYDDFMTMNEIYMIDLYTILGINYNPDSESKKNLFDVFINIYFPHITYDRLEHIIELLNKKNDNEISGCIKTKYSMIKNDMKLEKEVYMVVESSKQELNKINKYFHPNYIIQSNIHVNINNVKGITGTTSNEKFNLYRIFDNFIVNDEYPFIQYQTLDSQITYKFYTQTEKLDSNEVLSKWFENSPYGISFKILIQNNKYIAINLHESGKIEYKITWKEEDTATIDDIINTYDYIRNLLKKINSENKKIKIIMPENDKFKYAFINTIQKFELPEDFKINHNDLSDFSRLFFPYISLVLEPKKRISKKNDVVDTVSKYGTYLRYKRINKYDNLSKMHLRILYFFKNYEITEKELIDEITKQFNVTEEYAIKEIDFVKNNYNKALIKSSKILKKLKNLPKSKPPGIGIDIQGKDRDKYKIRITGARNKEQLEEIVTFMKVLIYLYTETYLFKKIKYQKLKETLRLLHKVAIRRNKVNEIIDYELTVNNIKNITAIDKKRLGFKPEKGQNQWSRECQNSGTDKKRRPDITTSNNIDKLTKSGYKLNTKTGFYEKTVELTIKKKKQTVTLRAVKLEGDNSVYNYYTCDPLENNKHFYIGFLSRGNNPNDLCMPCCFKKDQSTANNKAKKNYYLKCVGEKLLDNANKTDNINLGDKVYILQETNKVQNNRFIYLPKYLDILFNKIWNHDHKIKNHYLYESKSGYYFKYTLKNDTYNFLSPISNIFDLEIPVIIEHLVQFLINDKDDIYYTFLNNGDIRETFGDKNNFIEFIKTSSYLEYDVIGELCSLPGVLSKNGIYFFILHKNNLIVKKNLEKDIIYERYYIDCLNFENYNTINENKDFIVIIKDNKYYHPIYKIIKDEKKDKKVKVEKIYNNNDQIKELKNYSNISCNKKLSTQIFGNYLLFCKNIINSLSNKVIIKKQYIDNHNKAKYLLLENNLLLPVFPSGISYNYKFDYIKNINKILNYESCIKELHKINKILGMNYIPKIIFYDKKEKDTVRIISIYLENELIIPIKSEIISDKNLKKLGIPSKFQTLNETIDDEIDKFNVNKIKIIDDRHLHVKQHLYKNESYNIYRLELSLFFENNKSIKNEIIEIVRNDKIDLTDKKNKLRLILFNVINNKLASKISKIDKVTSFATIENNLPTLDNYNIDNLRDYCKVNKNKDTCNAKPHCKWDQDSCKFRLTENLAIDFVNKVIEEMVQNNIQFKELIQENSYYVSDIFNENEYSSRSNQKIIKTSNFNLNKIMEELFGKNNIPTIGRKEYYKNNNDTEIIEDYPEFVELNQQIYQKIISNKDSIIRAFANCYYWINNELYDIESRNLGYFSEMQTLLTNHLKAKIIDYIQNVKNDDKFIINYFNQNSTALSKLRKLSYNTDCKLELYVLSLLTNYRIVVYNNYYTIIGLYLQGEVKINDENIKNFTKDEFKNKTIFVKLEFDGSNTIPKNIYSIYYK